MVSRVRRARLVGTVVVATTTDPADDQIADLAARGGVMSYRGHATDLLDRHYQAARLLGAEHVVKIPSDCPLIDPAVIDRVLARHLAARGALDYTSNLHPPTYPDGNDVEVCSWGALARAWREALRPLDREHTTPFLWDPPERFRTANVTWETGRDLSRSHRVVLDYPQDYWVIHRIYSALCEANPAFTVADVVTYLDAHPQVAALNAHYRGVNWYRHHLDELTAVSGADTCQLAAELG
jgi:spore coat polysaccharide biosynthesis protein SpsF